jgi:hypothetical protein
VFADGGLVGRDGARFRTSDEETAEANDQMKFDQGHTVNTAMKLLRDLMPGFADGGLVTLQAAGGRRSSAPSIELPTAQKTAVDNTVQAPMGVNTSQDGAATGGSSRGSLNPGAEGAGDSAFAGNLRDALGIASKVNTVTGAVGVGSVPGLGIMNSMANVDTREQALRAFGLLALGMVSPPAALALNALMPTPTLSPAQATRALEGASPEGGYDPAKAPTDADVDTTDVDTADAGNFGGARGSFGGFGGGFNSAANTGPGSGFGGGMNGGVNAADGGHIKGPGTGISDSIPARLSKGEYVISKDVVDAVGSEFFDTLQQLLHTPAAVQRTA